MNAGSFPAQRQLLTLMETGQTSGRRLANPAIRPIGKTVPFTFDGQPLTGLEGETLAAALTAAGILGLRRTRDGAPRGVFCGMGICFECVVDVDGRPGQRACLTKLVKGMKVRHQPHGGHLPAPDDPPLAEPPEGPIPLQDPEVLIIGAGPAGLTAAEAAALGGCRVTLLDERPEPGGQYFKQLAPSQQFANPAAMDQQFAAGQALIERLRGLGVEIVSGAAVWNATWRGEESVQVDVIRDGQAARYRPAQLILATGAYERPLPVPGWTLPGFMTTGAAQTLGRAYRVAPGSRVLIAGNGPLNLQVACELARGGVKVVAVAEAAPAPGPAKLGAIIEALRRAPGLMVDGFRYMASLRRFGIPVLYGYVLTGAAGDARVARATLVRMDASGRPVAGSERSFEVDAVCSGYGFQPSTQITRLLGCEHRVDGNDPAQLLVNVGEDGATSRAGVFAVGDCTGIGGARVALSRGALAGWAATRNMGRGVPATAAPAEAKVRRALIRDLAFQRALWRIFAAPPLFYGPLADNVTVCRCEGVTAGRIADLIAGGVNEIGAIKRLTRAGMGRCQGRYCAALVARACAQATGRDSDAFSLFAPRFPLQPVPAAALASEKPEWNEADQGMAPPPITRRGNAADTLQADIVVIGAGIIGTCAAYYMAREGLDVVQVERGQPNGEASGRNAGSLHVQLLSYDFGDRAQAGGLPAAQALPLHRDSAAMWPALAEDLGRELEIKRTGGLMVAENARQLELLRRKTELERSFGIDSEIITAAELCEMEPAVNEGMEGAAWCPAEGKINPMLATPAILDGALAAGVRLYKEAEVWDIERDAAGFLVRTGRGNFRASKVLNAAGGWSSQIASMVGLDLPTRANPIQLIVTEPASPMVDRLLAHAERHLTLKQVPNGNLIIGGGWRARLDPETRRPTVLGDSFEGNLWAAQRVVPALRAVHVIRSWAAMNVAIDGAPILGEAPGIPGFYNAVTVNGVTLGPIIGRLTAEMVRTGRAGSDVAPFTLARFG